MVAKEVVSGLYAIKLGPVNAYLIDAGDEGLTLVDSGYPKNAAAIEEVIRSIGREPSDLTDILITHAHPDHLGTAAHFSAVASIAMHADDAAVARRGVLEQTMSPGPGLLNGILFRLFIGSKPAEFPAFEVSRTLGDGDVVATAGGIEVIHTPGHTRGHVSLLWRRDRGVVFVGDAAANMAGLGYSIGYEDLAVAEASLVKLARRDFEVAVFGHGRPITSNAASRFARRFGDPAG